MEFKEKLTVILDTTIDTGKILLQKDTIFVNPKLAGVIGVGILEFVIADAKQNELTPFGRMVHEALLELAKKEVVRLENILEGE